MWARDIKNIERATLIDVRYREEFDQNNVPGSVNIPWDMHLYYLEELKEYGKPLVFFCDEGYCSGLVVLSLRILGFEDVYNGGAWMDMMREMDSLLPNAA